MLTDISGRPLANPSTPTVTIRLQLEVILFCFFEVNISTDLLFGENLVNWMDLKNTFFTQDPDCDVFLSNSKLAGMDSNAHFGFKSAH